MQQLWKRMQMPLWYPPCMATESSDCRGLREKCNEAGLNHILLYVGGNIVVGKQPFDEVEARFKKMGFDRVFGPGHCSGRDDQGSEGGFGTAVIERQIP